MRRRWKYLGGGGVVGFVIAIGVLGHSPRVAGDTSTSISPSTPAASPADHDPFTPYPLGPGSISYDDGSVSDKAAIDAEQEAIETQQQAPSVDEWSSAATEAANRAQAQIAARQVGLDGTSQDGVVP